MGECSRWLDVRSTLQKLFKEWLCRERLYLIFSFLSSFKQIGGTCQISAMIIPFSKILPHSHLQIGPVQRARVDADFVDNHSPKPAVTVDIPNTRKELSMKHRVAHIDSCLSWMYVPVSYDRSLDLVYAVWYVFIFSMQEASNFHGEEPSTLVDTESHTNAPWRRGCSVVHFLWENGDKAWPDLAQEGRRRCTSAPRY